MFFLIITTPNQHMHFFRNIWIQIVWEMFVNLNTFESFLETKSSVVIWTCVLLFKDQRTNPRTHRYVITTNRADMSWLIGILSYSSNTRWLPSGCHCCHYKQMFVARFNIGCIGQAAEKCWPFDYLLFVAIAARRWFSWHEGVRCTTNGWWSVLIISGWVIFK